MIGVIRLWDILSHPVVTIRCFGWRIFFQSLWPWNETTFLTLLTNQGFFDHRSPTVPEDVQYCVRLEIQASHIYQLLARRFVDIASVREFFESLAEQEQDHADLLELCRASSWQGHWEPGPFETYRRSLPQLHERMQEIVAELDRVATVEDAMRLVLKIEGSEVNQLFLGVVRATNSPFTRKLRPFREAVDQHLSYIARQISQLAPQVMTADA